MPNNKSMFSLTIGNGYVWLFPLLLLLCLFFYPSTLRTQISFNHKTCLLKPTHFTLQWQHSVEKQLWQEEYVRKEHTLLLEKTWFETFGAGTPNNLPLSQEKKAGFVGFIVNQPLKELNWVVSANMKGTILLNKKQWLIYQLVDDYTTVHIQANTYSFIDIFFTKDCDDFFKSIAQP